MNKIEEFQIPSKV